MQPRAERLERLAEAQPRVLVIGGGITGAGIALDLALRGISTGLVERDDWAAATSSASSRLIHGGLRYLEQGELGLVRESCVERARLLVNAAGLVWPERFLFPLQRGGVSRVKLAAGLALYTAISLPRPLGLPHLIGSARLQERIPGINPAGLLGAGVYLDGATDDARLTLAVMLSGVEAGVTAVSRLEATSLEAGKGGVAAKLVDRLGGEEFELTVEAVVLAGGPFTDELRSLGGLQDDGRARWLAPTRGSHILVPRERLPTDGAVIFSSPVDGRIMFLIPWPRFTCIGTTDLDVSATGDVRTTGREVRYLLDSANGLVPSAGLTPTDVTATWAGLRPLLASSADPSKRSREERVEVQGRVLSIAGGKLTGYRAMAEKAAGRVAAILGEPSRRKGPTRRHRLVGALANPVGRPVWSTPSTETGSPAGPEPRVHAWAKRYGDRGAEVARACREAEGGMTSLDLDTLLGEVDWVVGHEDAHLPSDVLLRRTDLGYSEAGEDVREPLLGRMTQLLGWDEAQRRRAEEDFDSTLRRRDAWREDT